MKGDENKWMTGVETKHGNAPLIISIPHAGLEFPAEINARFNSNWLVFKDVDWHIEKLYDFATALDATIIRTPFVRTLVDMNRDPNGVSLYPGMATTEVCPTTTFDGEPLYRKRWNPTRRQVDYRITMFWDCYHAQLDWEIERLRRLHSRVVLYDCHSIRSRIPRLFDGELPHFNIGTNDGKSCDPALTAAIEACIPKEYSQVTNGRFKGGYITRRIGKPEAGVHAVQMELAMRGYLREPIGPVDETNWPPPYDPEYAEPMRRVLKGVLQACLRFAYSEPST